MAEAMVVSDLGEFDFLARVVFPSLGLEEQASEDAEVISGHGCDLVVTVDKGNRPVLFLLGVEDWRAYGWHVVAATLSDLAAAGARPLAFSSSIVLPADFRITDARDFFVGVRLACESFAVTLAGGNVAQGNVFEAHGFAAGDVPSGTAIRRQGCDPGDAIFLIGDGGLFMSAFLTAERLGISALSDRQRTSLTRPAPKLEIMQALRQRNLIQAASDDSDGVLGAVWNLATASGVGVEISEDRIPWPAHVMAAAELTNIDKRAIFFAWGGLQMAVAVRPHDRGEVTKVCGAHGVPLLELGIAEKGPPRLIWSSGEDRATMHVVRNEGFTDGAYGVGSAAAVDDYLRKPLQSS